jgi:hypothetical protein
MQLLFPVFSWGRNRKTRGTTKFTAYTFLPVFTVARDVEAVCKYCGVAFYLGGRAAIRILIPGPILNKISKIYHHHFMN